MDAWLSDFAYRIPLSPLVFVLVGLAATLIAWATVSYQSMRAALMNPIDSLKRE